MAAAIIDLYIEQGTDWTKTFKFYSDAGQTQPIDFTGCTGRCKIRDLDGNIIATPIVTFSAPTTGGTLVLTLENALTGGGVLGGDKGQITDVLATVGISPSRRGETLGIAEFLQIAEEVARRQ